MSRHARMSQGLISLFSSIRARRARGSAVATLAVVVLATVSVPVRAQVSTHYAYQELIDKSRQYQSLDENMFGDKVNLQDGVISFDQTDVLIKTNSQLTLSIGRKSHSSYEPVSQFPVFGIGWELNVPYMMATYDSRDGWNSGANDGQSVAGNIGRRRITTLPYYFTRIYAQCTGTLNINTGQGAEQLYSLAWATRHPTPERCITHHKISWEAHVNINQTNGEVRAPPVNDDEPSPDGDRKAKTPDEEPLEKGGMTRGSS